MRPTTLLDTMSQGGSGAWARPSTAEEPTHDQVTVRTDARPAAALTQIEGQEFKELVAGLVPCRNNDPELWFAEQSAQVEQAKALCKECPLAAACLTGAMDRAEPWGVWGGEVFVDGVVVAKKRGRGRPRKTEVR